MALTRKGAPFVWTDRQQAAFEALKVCLISAPTEDGPPRMANSCWTQMPVFLWWGSSEPDSRGSGSGYCLCQPKPSPFSATVLYDAYGDVGGGSYVHAFPIVSLGGSVHPSHRSQFSLVDTEAWLWIWDVGSLVHVFGPVLGYF